MFSRSSRRKRKMVSTPAKVEIIKPQPEQEPALDLSQASISIIKPDTRLKVMVEDKGEDK